MLSHIMEWAAAVLGAGVVAGLVHDLRRRINGPPEVW
jgi:hypothetical protein